MTKSRPTQVFASRRRFLSAAASAGALLAIGPLGGATKAPKKSKVRVVFYTDVHAMREWDVPLALERAADAINAQQADLIVNAGDLVHGGFTSSEAAMAPRWDTYMAMHNALRGDVYSAIGNHDLIAVAPSDGTPPSKDPRATFRTRLGLNRTYYSFDALGYHFMVLDAIQFKHNKFGYIGQVDALQMEWIQSDLSHLPKSKPIVLISHIPLLTAFYAATIGPTRSAPESHVVVNNIEVLDAFKQHNLILVLQGHLHVNEWLRWRKTTFITGGAICGKWWQGPRMGTEEGFGVVTLYGDHVEWEYVDYGWEAKRP